MRVEQRIGRIDRIGQKNKVVKVINYAYKDSIDGDIYEELEERLKLFENVVGPMRPVLNSIESDIKNAVMGGTGDNDVEATEQVVTEADSQAKQAKEKAEETGLDDDSETAATREAIIESSGLDGWEKLRHPSLERIGGDDRAYDPVVSVGTIETLLTQSDRVKDAGWSFTALRNHDRVEAYDGVSDGAFVLEVSDGEPIAVPGSIGETAQEELGRVGGVVVTFQPEIAEEYPSIRLLLPGDPLFDVLVDIAADGEAPIVEMVYGRGRGGTAEVTIGESSQWDGDADVVAPATTEESVTDLLGGGSVETVDEAEETVLDWLSAGIPGND
jgi:hypothetical protein